MDSKDWFLAFTLYNPAHIDVVGAFRCSRNRLAPATVRTAAVLARAADADGITYIPQKRIAAEAGIQQAQVSVAFRTLMESGWLERVSTKPLAFRLKFPEYYIDTYIGALLTKASVSPKWATFVKQSLRDFVHECSVASREAGQDASSRQPGHGGRGVSAGVPA